MTGWLIETLIWTGVLLALVLVVRRPVARVFGPAAAYALWFVPLLRMLLPPVRVVLPAVHVAPVEAGELAMAATPATADVAMAPAVVAFDPMPWLIALWLAGALLVLARRLLAYHLMRRRLLAGSLELRRIGRVRVIESAATPMPVAFGVIAPHVAVPEGFFAGEHPLAARLALQHELQHHAGGDLLVNLAMQPLFALHWFNPIAQLAWRALRSDQEAACDARVVAMRDPAQRACYAALLARYAAEGRPLALVPSPLACPMGEGRSIIHRLRSLAMPQQSNRRRLAGRLLVAAGVLVLPLTASVTYAAGEMPAPPAPPAPPAAPDARLPPLPPAPPPAPDAHHPGHRVIVINRQDGKGGGQTRTVNRGNTTITVTTDHPVSDAEIDRMIADAHREAERGMAEARQGRADAAEARAEAESQRAMTRTEIIRIQRDAHRQAMEAMRDAPRVERVACNAGETTEASSSDTDGKHVIRVRICAPRAAALDGLRHARHAIADSQDMPSEGRERALRAIDERIAEMEKAG